MIAYDIDGVFLGDMRFLERGQQRFISPKSDGFYFNREPDPFEVVPWDAHNKSVLDMRTSSIYPIFVPDGKYYLISGRPVKDYDDTMLWVNKYFDKNPPQKVFIGCQNHGNEPAANFKAHILNQRKDISLFIESSEEQMHMIRDKLKRDVEIVLFEEMIKNAISRFFGDKK